MKEIYKVKSLDQDDLIEVVNSGFHIKEVNREEGFMEVEPRTSHEASFDTVLKELVPRGLYPLYRREDGKLTMRIANKSGRKRTIRPLFHGALLLATIFTVTLAGYIWWAGGDLINSLYFTAGLMGILGSHELGHALVARRNKVDATLPFFLPVPPFFAFGTLGAVIFMNSPIPDRKSLFDIGIAGPVTGFVLSLPVLLIGISLSSYTPFDPSHNGLPFLLGTPLLFNIFVTLIHGQGAQGSIFLAHPIAIAGWAGIFVTSLNLLPMGQLDGGHVIRSVFPRKYRDIYTWVFRILIVMGSLGAIGGITGLKWLSKLSWPGWLVWAVLVYFMTRLNHPGPLNDVSPLDNKRRLASIGVLLIFLLSFTPVPIVPL